MSSFFQYYIRINLHLQIQRLFGLQKFSSFYFEDVDCRNIPADSYGNSV